MIGETLYAAVVGPPVQEYEPPPLAVRLVEDPEQILVVPDILIVGTAFTVTVVVDDVDDNPCAL